MFIEFEKLLNGRELGGIPAAGGRKIKSGVFIRTAELARATDADLALLADKFAVKHIVDFRDPDECERSPDRMIKGAKYHNLPALPALPIDGPAEPVAFPSDIRQMFRRIYRELAESDAAQAAYTEFFRILLEGDGAVLFHCTQGKDRTGVAALLLLTALGVSTEDILADYMLSNDGLRGEYGVVSSGLDESGTKRVAEIYFVSRECFDLYLSIVTEKFGGARGVLTERLGLTESDISRLIELYTE